MATATKDLKVLFVRLPIDLLERVEQFRVREQIKTKTGAIVKLLQAGLRDSEGRDAHVRFRF